MMLIIIYEGLVLNMRNKVAGVSGGAAMFDKLQGDLCSLSLLTVLIEDFEGIEVPVYVEGFVWPLELNWREILVDDVFYQMRGFMVVKNGRPCFQVLDHDWVMRRREQRVFTVREQAALRVDENVDPSRIFVLNEDRYRLLSMKKDIGALEFAEYYLQVLRQAWESRLPKRDMLIGIWSELYLRLKYADKQYTLSAGQGGDVGVFQKTKNLRRLVAFREYALACYVYDILPPVEMYPFLRCSMEMIRELEIGRDYERLYGHDFKNLRHDDAIRKLLERMNESYPTVSCNIFMRG